MTDKQIIKLKPMEDLNETIIKEKGNTKCIFYADDICRNGDKTRDCINCARVEYHSLYSLNWDNQERLQKIIKHKEQECERLKEEFKLFQQLKDEDSFRVIELSTENVKLKHQLDLYKNTHKTEQNRRRAFEQTLAEIKEIAENNKNSTLCFTAFEGDVIEVNNEPMTAILQKINEVEDGLV